MSPEEQLIEMRKCIDDPVYFYENYFLINGEKPPKLSEGQKEYMRAIAKAKQEGTPIILTKPRSGARVMSAALIEDLSRYFPNAKLLRP